MMIQVALCLVMTFSSAPAAGASRELDIASTLADLALPIALHDGELHGRGAEILREAFVGSQFVCVGEQHFLREVPQFTQALFEELCAHHGYGYLALETGWAFAEHLGSAPVRGDLDEIERAYRGSPMSLGFGTKQELALIGRVGELSAAPDPVIWGLDHATGGSFLLESLRAATEDDKGAIQDLLDDARTQEARRLAQPMNMASSYLIAPSNPDAFVQLENLGASKDARRKALLEAIVDARAYYVDSMRSRADPTARTRVTRQREADMQRRFADRYRKSVESAGGPCRVVVKAGGLHANRLVGPAESSSLGALLHGIARSNAATSVHVLAVGHGEDGISAVRGQAPFMRELQREVAGDAWSLIDLREVHDRVAAGAFGELDRLTHQTLLGFDFLVLISPASRADWLGEQSP